MRATFRVYWRLLAAGFRRQSTYRLAALGGLTANITFGMIKVAVLFATVRAAGGQLHGYDIESMSTYIWLSQGLLGCVNLDGRTDLALRVKSGQVAVDFLRPIDLQATTIATEVGRSLFSLLPRGIPSVLVGVFLVGMAMPGNPAFYLLGAVSLILATATSAATVYLVAVAGFWLVETRGLRIFYQLISGFLSGLVLPLSLFPGWLGTVAEATPFPSMMQYPVNVLSGLNGLAGAAQDVAPGYGRQGQARCASRRGSAGVGAVDDDHADRGCQLHPAADRRADSGRVPDRPGRRSVAG